VGENVSFGLLSEKMAIPGSYHKGRGDRLYAGRPNVDAVRKLPEALKNSENYEVLRE